MRISKDVELDASIAVAGGYAKKAGLRPTPEEVLTRRAWLKKQSRQYIHAVEMKIREIEHKLLMERLK